MPTELPEDHEDNTGQSSIVKKYFSLINFMLIIVLGITLVIVIQTRPNLKPQVKQITQTTTALKINQIATQQALQAEISSQQKNLKQVEYNVVELMKDATLSTRNQQLRLIKNLIYQAQYTINLNFDLDRALQLIKLAKNKIIKLKEPDFMQLTNELNKVINKIKQSQHVFEINRTIRNINNIRSLVQQLPKSPEKSFVPPVTQPSQPEGKHWYSKVKTILCGFKNLVIIRHHNQPISPLLTDNEVQIIKNNIALELNQAQSALLTHNQKLFSSSIVTTTKQIKRLPKQQPTAKILQQLSQLTELNINPPRPSLSTAIAAINKLTEPAPSKSLSSSNSGKNNDQNI